MNVSIGDQIMGRFTVVKEIPNATTGDWYACTDEKGAPRLLSFEQYPDESRDEMAARVAAWKRLDHPGIPKLELVWPYQSGHSLLVLECDLINALPLGYEGIGRSFNPIVDDRPMEFEESEASRRADCGRIIISIAEALAALAEQGFVHGDVKPYNLYWNRTENKAVIMGMSLLPGGYTPAFCSMEQMDQKPLTVKTDVYNWAVSILSLYLAGHPWPIGPVAGLNRDAYLDDARDELPDGMRELLSDCLETEPEARPDWPEILSRLHAIFDACGNGDPCTETVYEQQPTLVQGVTVAEDVETLIAALIGKQPLEPRIPDRGSLTQDGKYRFGKFISCLGDFPMFEAEEISSKQRMTLLLPGMTHITDAAERLAREAAFKAEYIESSRIFHTLGDAPHRTPVLRWYSPEDIQGKKITYLVAEQPVGVDLYEWAEENPFLSEKLAAQMTIQLLRALHALHTGDLAYMGQGEFAVMQSKSMVHRRVSPNYVRMVKHFDGQLQLMLTGFACAVPPGRPEGWEPDPDVDEPLVCSGVFACYDELAHQAPSVAWDLWSAADCLNFLLTGESVRLTAARKGGGRIRYDEIHSGDGLRDIGYPMRDILRRALNETNGLYYTSASDFMADLCAFSTLNEGTIDQEKCALIRKIRASDDMAYLEKMYAIREPDISREAKRRMYALRKA